ncbi:MAG: DUF5946 family protein [Candidatus Aminicenantaceae bacterium]
MACSCGAPSQGECHAYFEAILAKEFSDLRYAKAHRLTVDTYSLQHPAVYMVSAKSFAAHLTGMCCAIEHGNDPGLLRKLQRWLNGKKQLEKPEMLHGLGTLTIFHLEKAQTGPEHIRLVWEWATDVWKAYAGYHDRARDWIERIR